MSDYKLAKGRNYASFSFDDLCVLSCFCQVRLFATLWNVACPWAPLSMGFSRQENWSGLPFPSPEDLPDPGIEPKSLISPAWAGRFFATSITWKAHDYLQGLEQ